MGLSAAIANSGRALGVFTTGLEVAGNNLANAATPGYARSELRLETAFPYTAHGQTVGGGVRAAGVRQAVDQHLESRLHAAAAGAAAGGATAELFAGLETILGELTDGDLSTALSDFAAAVGAVVAEPTSSPLRRVLLDEGAALAADFQSLHARAGELAGGLDGRADALVSEANGLIGDVDRLNGRIASLERGRQSNSDAGTLRDQRYAAMRRLSEIVPLDYRETEAGAVELRTGGDWLLLGISSQTLERGGDGVVRTSRTRRALGGKDGAGGGELGGVLDGAGRIVGGFLADLDGLAAGLIETVNRVHTGGRGFAGHAAVTAARTVDRPGRVAGGGRRRAGVAVRPFSRGLHADRRERRDRGGGGHTRADRPGRAGRERHLAGRPRRGAGRGRGGLRGARFAGPADAFRGGGAGTALRGRHLRRAGGAGGESLFRRPRRRFDRPVGPAGSEPGPVGGRPRRGAGGQRERPRPGRGAGLARQPPRARRAANRTARRWTAASRRSSGRSAGAARRSGPSPRRPAPTGTRWSVSGSGSPA